MSRSLKLLLYPADHLKGLVPFVKEPKVICKNARILEFPDHESGKPTFLTMALKSL